MAGFDKLFGLGLMIAGVVIAIYYTIWVLLCLPLVSRKFPIWNFFLNPSWLFKLPALALVVGLCGIGYFIDSTNKKIAAKKQAELEAKSKKTN